MSLYSTFWNESCHKYHDQIKPLSPTQMLNVAVFPIIDFDGKPRTPLTRLMSDRLERLAVDLQLRLEKVLPDSGNCEKFVVYLSYNRSYAIRWMIINDVPENLSQIAAILCADLGYITWKVGDLQKSDRTSSLI